MAKRANASNNRTTQAADGQTALPLVEAASDHLDIGALETWLWDAACAIRGAADAPKYKDFILPLIFYKRLSDVFDDEFTEQVTFLKTLPLRVSSAKGPMRSCMKC